MSGTREGVQVERIGHSKSTRGILSRGSSFSDSALFVIESIQVSDQLRRTPCFKFCHPSSLRSSPFPNTQPAQNTNGPLSYPNPVPYSCPSPIPIGPGGPTLHHLPNMTPPPGVSIPSYAYANSTSSHRTSRGSQCASSIRSTSLRSILTGPFRFANSALRCSTYCSSNSSGVRFAAFAPSMFVSCCWKGSPKYSVAWSKTSRRWRVVGL
jgi:hypothetical protein